MTQVTGSNISTGSHFTDETFDSTRSRTYIYLCKFSGLSFSSAVYDPVQNKFILFKEYIFPDMDVNLAIEELEKVLVDDEYFNLQYKRVNVAMLSKKSVIVPSEYFDKNLLKDYLEASFFLNDIDTVNYNYIKQADSYNVFTVNGRIFEFFSRKHKNIGFFHQYTPMLNHGFKYYNPDSVIIDCKDSILSIVSIESNKINNCSTFDITSNEDALYYILFFTKTNRINQFKANFFISNFSPDLFSMLKEQFNSLKPDKYKEGDSFSYTFKISEGKNIPLFNLKNCE